METICKFCGNINEFYIKNNSRFLFKCEKCGYNDFIDKKEIEAKYENDLEVTDYDAVYKTNFFDVFKNEPSTRNQKIAILLKVKNNIRKLSYEDANKILKILLKYDKV